VDLDRLASWLRCPTCGAGLQAAPPLVLRCERGHAVDVNKRGYASLLAPGTRVTGDTAEMLHARGRFLERGHYAPVVDALAGAVGAAPAPAPAPEGAGAAASASASASVQPDTEPDRDVRLHADAGSAPRDERDSSPLASASAGHRQESRVRVLDAGCGTGHYLHALIDRLPDAVGLAADLSPIAVARAVRDRPDVDGVVADTWASLPLRDGIVDLVLDVFAPRNLPEFHRVLAPGGHVAIVAAGPRHLDELRASGRAVGVQEDKRERILDAADRLFEAVAETRVHRVLRLGEDDVGLLLGMGPSAHHTATQRRAVAQAAGAEPPGQIGVMREELQDVTIDVMIHVLRRRDTSASA
jgi:23S rRNA (guanine745-N1)-methyltransferase